MKRKKPVSVFIIFCATIICNILMSVSIWKYNKNIGIAGIAASVVLAAAAVITYLIVSRNSLRHITKMNNHLETSAAEYMNTLPAPIAVIGKGNKIVWYNRAFIEEICLGYDVYGMSFEECVKLSLDSLTENGSSICKVNGNVYDIFYEEFTENDITFLITYFQDKTDYYTLKKTTEDSFPNVVVISIDAYSEIMQNAKESEKARASVEIEQLMETFMEGTDGFIKRTAANTFYAVIEHRHLEEKIRTKFKILDLARAIKIAGTYSLTLSIGVGEGAASLAESEKIARQCLDMALGRGGDQAVVKTDSGYRFFGGVSKGIENYSRTKTRVIANAMQDIISGSDKVFIMGHRFGDLDSVGASCGLAGALRLMDKNVYVVVDKNKNLAVNLIDAVEKNSDESFFISPSAAVQNITENDLVIVVDTHNKDFIESRELYEKCKQVVVVDHHRKTVNYIDNAVIFYHEPYASSASEMITEIIQYFKFPGDEKIPSYCAEALLAGIMLDTKNFVIRTGVRTFEAAAFLKKSGADTVAVKQLFSNSFDSYKRRSEIVASARIYHNCAVAAADFQSDDIRIVAPQAADELLNIKDVDASFVIFRTNNITNISARSLGNTNVQVIMEKLGGGGHQTMAAAQLENKSVKEAADLLLSAIESREEELAE